MNSKRRDFAPKGLLRSFSRSAKGAFQRSSVDLTREIDTIRSSGLFDFEYYLAKNPGVASHPEGALRHFVQIGDAQGCDPHPLFRTEFIRPRRWGRPRMSALMSYLTDWTTLRVDPTPLFDTDFYRRSNTIPPGDNPLRHYLEHGGKQENNPHPLFDTSWYLQQNPEVRAAGINPLLHYVTVGWKMGMEPHPLFSSAYLAATYAAVTCPSDMSPLEHFLTASYPANASPSALFDSAFYRYQIEVDHGRKLSTRPILHYLMEGHRDLRLRPSILFDPEYYIANNEVSAGEPALVHYRKLGDHAGFATHPHFNAGLYNSTRSGDKSSLTAIEHFYASSANDVRISHRQMTRPISKSIIGLIRKVADNDYEFELDCYLDMYPGVNRQEVLRHYRNVGSKHGLSVDLRKCLKRKGWKITDIPLGFYHDEYAALNPDLQHGVGFDFLPLFIHYVRFGRDESRAIGKWQFYIDLKDYCIANLEATAALPQPSSRKGVCLLLHIYYGELFPELVSYANSFGSNLQDVFINVVETSWTPELHRKIRDLCPGAFVMVSKNVGRDIGGFLRLLENIDIGKYELFALMHTKMSPHVAKEKAEFWRRKLLNAFAGNTTIASRSVEAFRNDPSIGLLGSRDWRNTEIAANSANFEKMLELFKIDSKYRNVEYLSGTMFLIRPEIVQRIHEVLKCIELEGGEGGSLAFNMDGQLAHAIERVIGNVVRQMGYRFEWVDS